MSRTKPARGRSRLSRLTIVSCVGVVIYAVVFLTNTRLLQQQIGHEMEANVMSPLMENTVSGNSGGGDGSSSTSSSTGLDGDRQMLTKETDENLNLSDTSSDDDDDNEMTMDESNNENAKSEDQTESYTQTTNDSTTITTTSSGEPAKYAYSFVIGGIDQEKPAYKGFLFNILIAVNILQKLGSQADFIVYTELSHESKLTSLPHDDLVLLQKMGVQVHTMEKPKYASFARLMYAKFNMLQLTQYRRIIYMDSDIMPLVNLDYLFHLSDPLDASVPTILRPNFVWATRGEPSNGGFFMLEPDESAWRLLSEVLEKQREEGRNIPYPHFDWNHGWGHDFVKEGDHWEGIVKKGTQWRFHGGHADQGLLYYYVKYVRQNVSIALGSKLQNWIPGSRAGAEEEGVVDGKPFKKSEEEGLLEEYSPKPLAYQSNCSNKKKDATHCFPPYRDMAHFTGQSNKPWQQGINHFRMKSENAYSMSAPYRLWFQELKDINVKLDMQMDVEKFDEEFLTDLKESPLGYMPWYTDNMKEIFKGHVHPDDKKDEDSDADGDESANEDTDENEGMDDDGSSDNGDVNDVKAISSPITSSLSKTDLGDPTVVAYAISFIKCGDHTSNVPGLIDASLVLRHSVHKMSRRNPESGSKYDYKMYAIVHRQAEECSALLKETGFEVIVVDPPLQPKEIKGEYLRKHIHKEWCCGHDEFVKLEAYTLPHEIIVHVDIDFAFYKPMDNLFDAILYDKSSPEGIAARKAIELERPDEALPDTIGAFITRDWNQVAPNKFPPAYQAGFLVARHDPTVMPELLDIIREGNYTHGWGNTFGWGNKGYGGVVGSMAMQGLVAYYYDHIRINSAIELNQCRYNHVGVDVLYRSGPNFRKSVPGVGGCRNGLDYCEDCMVTDVNKIYSVHYTICRKPWQCMASGKPGARAPLMNTLSVNATHCLELVQKWHNVRTDFENELYALTNDDTIKDGAKGMYKPDVFGGHCSGNTDGNYLTIAGKPETFKRVGELYATANNKDGQLPDAGDFDKTTPDEENTDDDDEPESTDDTDDENKAEDFSSDTTDDKAPSIITSSLPKTDLGDPTVVAYAISFIKCGDKQSKVPGLLDASLVLRHSVHKTSRRNPESGSKYDYKMYAIVHRQAEECSGLLKETGFEVIVVDPPIQPKEIKGDHLQKHIHREWCCGHDEFIKLEAYTLPHEIIVHVDIDFAFYKPMDNLFDAILYDKDSPEGIAARKAIELERPTEEYPDKIGAFITRDWPQVAPNKFPPAYQAGFLVARHDPTVMPEVIDIIREGNYTNGWGRGFGWGNQGYGGYVGAMAMQGLMGYYYDFIRPNSAVELNQCRYNHMGIDVLYRHQPNFRPNLPGVGGCRNNLDYCEDCMVTEMEKIYNVHYTLCRKPWQCVAKGEPGGRNPIIDTHTVNLEHCHEIVRKWHDVRTDLENELYLLTNDETIKTGSVGKYEPDVFGGHCNEHNDYLQIKGTDETFRRLGELY